MNRVIPVSIFNLSQNYSTLFDFFSSIKLKDEDMVFFSKSCYDVIKEKSKIVSETIMPVSSKNFYNFIEETKKHENYSLIPMFSGEWYYLEYYSHDSTYFSNYHKLPESIKLVMLENEFVKKDIQVKIVVSSPDESPVDFILNDHNPYKNSFLILTENAVLSLSKSTNLISQYRGICRLSWDCDDSYPGANITLKALVTRYHYLIEYMQFESFDKAFSIKGLPDSIIFVV